jgi:hypothetical protein
VASAAEAELGTLFLNAQEAKVIRLIVEELSHPQPPTPIHVDTITTVGIVNNRSGTRLGGSKSNMVNLILRLFMYHFFTYHELVMSRVNPQQHKQPTNTTTMVMEQLAPPAAWS